MSKPLLRFDSVSFAYPGWRDFLLEKISFSVHEQEKIGLLGYNGTGKTTMLDIVAGIKEPTKGEIIRTCPDLFYFGQEDYAFGNMTARDYLARSDTKLHLLYSKIKQEETLGIGDALKFAALVDEFRERGGYDFLVSIEKAVHEFGFNGRDMDRSLSTFSGGEKRILKILSGFVLPHDLILLDEPTNYLDEDGIGFLARAVKSSRSAFLIVSHDRWFLDETVDHIIEIEQRTVREYAGNYTLFYLMKNHEIKTKLRKKEKIASEISKLKEIERKYKIWGTRKEKQVKSAADRGYVSHKAAKLMKKALQAKTRVQTKIGQLEKTKPYIEKYYAFHFDSADMPKGSCFSANLLTKGFGNRTLFKDLSFTVEWGEKVAITGPNGSGKTTLLKIIMAKEDPDSGRVVWGKLADVGYLPQTWAPQDDNFLVDSLFTDEQKERANDLIGVLKVMAMGNVFPKKLGELSEGQKRKIKLVQLILSAPNLLILDEPTTHLDYQTVEFLEQALIEYAGTVILVSHDRFLKERVTTREIKLS
jgi:ATP-binding cassette subfamily F protein 3